VGHKKLALQGIDPMETVRIDQVLTKTSRQWLLMSIWI